MVKTLVLHREDTKVIYCLGGGEEIHLTNAVIRIVWPETTRQIKTISFGTQEEADNAIYEELLINNKCIVKMFCGTGKSLLMRKCKTAQKLFFIYICC